MNALMLRFLTLIAFSSVLVVSQSVGFCDEPIWSADKLLSGVQDVEFRALSSNASECRIAADGSVEIRMPDHKKATIDFAPVVAGTHWDFSEFSYFRIDMENKSDALIQVQARLDCGPDAQDWKDSSSSQAFLLSGESQTLGIPFPRSYGSYDGPRAFASMSAKPNGHRTHWKNFEPAKVSRFKLKLISAKKAACLKIQRVQLGYPYGSAKNKHLESLPLIDKFGQFRNLQWPGKCKSITPESSTTHLHSSNLKERFDPWGGWREGPQLKGTGHFRTQKVDGRWWLVTPEGRLFWSHGCNTVGFRGFTPTDAKKKSLFEWLPTKGDSIFDASVKQTKDGDLQVSMHRANLYRKYGPDWKVKAGEKIHQRLHRWGINTLGAWTHDSVSSMSQTPYTPVVHLWGPFLTAFQSHKIPNPFAPSFESNLRKAIGKLRTEIGDDPWCVGIFVGNEIAWDNKIIPTVLAQDENSHAKQQLLNRLKQQYSSIGQLNHSWKTDFESWRELALHRQQLSRTQERTADFDQLLKHYSAVFYNKCRHELKRQFPNHLYLGSRIHTCPWSVSHSAAEYADVYSVNHYWFEAGPGTMPNHVDKPVLITEFHFGCLDRGSLGPSLVPVHNQLQRARSYANYVAAGLLDPRIVGTHWFAYLDQSPLGRPGENYNIGLVDIADSPYPELTRMTSAVGDLMYELRSSRRGSRLENTARILREYRQP